MLTKRVRVGLGSVIAVLLIALIIIPTGSQVTRALDGRATIISTHQFWAQDTDGDSLYDRLWVNVSLRVDVQDGFMFYLYLMDQFNVTPVASAFNTTYLLSGTNKVSMIIEGHNVRISGIDGPYFVLVELRDARLELESNWGALSPSYLAAEFENPPLTVGKPYGDFGVDLDVPADGLYNQMRIRVPVNLTEQGSYWLTLSLMSTGVPQSIITETSLTIGENRGDFVYELNLSGFDIWLSGVDGPYEAVVEAYDVTQAFYVVSNSTNLTGSYMASEFQSRTFMTVTGSVRDMSGAPLEAQVIYTNYSDLYQLITYTDVSGNYGLDVYLGEFGIIIVPDLLGDYEVGMAMLTVSGPGPYNFTLGPLNQSAIEYSYTMSDPDTLVREVDLTSEMMTPWIRMMLDWTLGNKDGFVSDAEAGQMSISLYAYDDTDENLQVDNVFYYPDDCENSFVETHYSGPVYSSLPVTITVREHMVSNRIIVPQALHVLEVNVHYDSDLYDESQIVRLPPGWIALDYNPITNITVTGIGTSAVAIDPLGNPNPLEIPSSAWVGIMIGDLNFNPIVVWDPLAEPDYQEYMQPVKLSAKVKSVSILKGVSVEVESMDGGRVGNYSMMFNASSGRYEYTLTNYQDIGNHIFTVWATDINGNAASNYAWFYIRDSIDPVADAGPDQIVINGTTVTFNGTGSTDNFPQLDYTWTFFNGTGSVTLYGAIANYVFPAPGEYVVTLTVQDPGSNRDTDTMTVTVLHPPTPNPPANVTAVQNGTDEVMVTWDPPTHNTNGSLITGELTYLVYRSNSSDDGYVLVSTSPVNETWFLDSGLQPGTYYYKVEAVNEWSNVSGPSSPPAMVTLSAGDEDGLQGVWLWASLLVIVVVIMISVLAIMRMKRRGRREELDDVDEASSESPKNM